MAKVPNGVEKLLKISTERYRRQTTNGRAIAYSERERERSRSLKTALKTVP